MKLHHTIILLASVIVGSFGAALWNRAVPVAAESKPAEIRTQSIVIIDEQGRECITMHGTKGGGGIWIGSQGKVVSIYNLPGQGPVISLTNADPKAANASPLALSLDKDGKPSIQFEGRDGKLHWIGPEELERAANKIP